MATDEALSGHTPAHAHLDVTDGVHHPLLDMVMQVAGIEDAEEGMREGEAQPGGTHTGATRLHVVAHVRHIDEVSEVDCHPGVGHPATRGAGLGIGEDGRRATRTVRIVTRAVDLTAHDQGLTIHARGPVRTPPTPDIRAARAGVVAGMIFVTAAAAVAAAHVQYLQRGR